jgi:hypothetical protein
VRIHMRKITLVCSSHREKGLCNAQELLGLLRAIDPDVIFEEVRQSDFAIYNTGTLEGQAATRFLALKSFQRVPVDRYDLPPNFRALTDSVFDCVEQRSYEYLFLQDQSESDTHLHGFMYLNSAAFAKVMTRMSAIEDETIKSQGNPELLRALATWRQVIQGREKAMVENIYRYCRDNIFNTGVFLVGAAHRSGIVKTIEESSHPEADLIEWILYL